MKRLLFSVLLLFSMNLFAAKIIIPTNKHQINFWKGGFPVTAQPGDTIEIQGTLRTKEMAFYNISGTALNPVVITCQNAGLELRINYPYSMKFGNCHYIKLEGKNKKFRVNGSGRGIGVTLEERTDNTEITGFEIYNTGFTGIMAKSDPYGPRLVNGVLDNGVRRNNHVLENININNCYIHDTGEGEGMYLGYTFPNKKIKIGNDSVVVQTQAARNIRVTNNILENTGSDGIQVSQCNEGLFVAYNTILDYGKNPFKPFQNSGIALGNDNKGVVKYNFVRANSTYGGNCVSIIGSENVELTNNTFIHKAGFAIYADEQNNARIIPGDGINIYKNTFISIAGTSVESIQLRTNRITNNIFDNYFLNNSGVYIYNYQNACTILDVRNIKRSS